MESKTSDPGQTEWAPGSQDRQLSGRRTVLRTAAASSVAAMIGLGAQERAAAAEPPDPNDLAVTFVQWQISRDGPDGPITPKRSFDVHPERNYSLLGLKTGPLAKTNFQHKVEEFLQWEEQTWGINLGWTDNDNSAGTEKKKRRWFFTKERGDESPVRYGDIVALGNGGQPSWLYYKGRTVGINLSWDDGPHYEWQILTANANDLGTVVNTRDKIAILNVRANDKGGEPLIYFDRTVGGNIGWPSSKTWAERIEEEWDWERAITIAIGILLGGGGETSAVDRDVTKLDEPQ